MIDYFISLANAMFLETWREKRIQYIALAHSKAPNLAHMILSE